MIEVKASSKGRLPREVEVESVETALGDDEEVSYVLKLDESVKGFDRRGDQKGLGAVV